MKRATSQTPAVIPTLALFIALTPFHPGLGWTPKTRGSASSAAELTRGVFAAAAPANGGRGRGPLFKDALAIPANATPNLSQGGR